MAMQRPSWKNRGKNFSDLGVLLECGKRDLTTVKNVLHYVTTGSAKFMFNVGKELFFVPVVMILKVIITLFGGKFNILNVLLCHLVDAIAVPLRRFHLRAAGGGHRGGRPLLPRLPQEHARRARAGGALHRRSG